MAYRLLSFCVFVLGIFAPQVVLGMEYLSRFPNSQLTGLVDVATDSAGHIYVCGQTSDAQQFPGAVRIGTTNPAASARDACLLKFGRDGRLLQSVLIGGEADDYAHQIAVDADGNVVLVGWTASASFPVTNGFVSSLTGRSDGFLIKLDSTATNILFSTFLGHGSSGAFPAMSIASSGEIVIAGSSPFADIGSSFSGVFFPLRTDDGAFVMRVAGDGSRLLNMTQVGGTDYDSIRSMALDSEGNVYLTGLTYSPDFPIVNALQSRSATFDETSRTPAASMFVMKLAPGGESLFATYLTGGSVGGRDEPQGIAVTEDGAVIVIGRTSSSVFPALDGAPAEVNSTVTNRLFVVELEQDGRSIRSTNFFPLTAMDSFSGFVSSPSSNLVAVVNVGGYFSTPAFLSWESGQPVLTGDPQVRCPTPSWINSAAMDSEGGIVVMGSEISGSPVVWTPYVARWSHDEWQGATPRVQIVVPVDGAKIAARPASPHVIRAAVLGNVAPVDWVKFFDGRRLVGTATNLPYQAVWKNPGRREHRLTAVAKVGAAYLTSCVAQVTTLSPKNDNFSARIPLRGERVSIAGDNLGATGEPPLEDTGESSVWYTWKVPSDGVYELEIADLVSTNSSSSLEATVYSGARLRELERVETVQSAFGGALNLQVRRGQVFQISVSTFSGLETRFRLSLKRLPQPANDSLTNAVPLTGSMANAVVSLRGATWGDEDNIGYGLYSGHPSVVGLRSVWYAWTAPTSGTYFAFIDGPGAIPSMRCFTDSGFGELSDVGLSISGETNGVSVQAAAGTRYLFQVMGGNTNDLLLSVLPWSRPANDDFASRILIPTGMNSATGTLIGATMEVGETTSSSSDTLAGSVWWTWSPQTSAVYSVFVTRFERIVQATGVAVLRAPGNAYSRVSVYRGSALGQLTNTAGNTLRSGSDFRFEAGEVYQIAVRDPYSRFRLEMNLVPPPDNDAFDAAVELSGPRIRRAGTTRAATIESFETNRGTIFAPSSDDRSVWYRWTAPTAGLFSFRADGLFLELYQGETISGAELVASGSDRIVTPVTAGTEYRLAVVSRSGMWIYSGGSEFILDIHPAHPPANDNFADRRVIQGMNTVFGGTRWDATLEGGEPPLDYYSPALGSVWYSWTAPTNGIFALRSTDRYASEHLAVFSGSSVSNLIRVADGTSYQNGTEFQARAGVTYHFAVVGSSLPGYAGFELELTRLSPPRNDRFAGRIRLSGASVSVTASNNGAGLEMGEPVSTYMSGQTVWWTWRAPRTGRATFAVEREDHNSMALCVYTGSSLTELVALTETNYPDGEINLPVSAGVEYQIAVDHRASGVADRFRLSIRMTGSPVNDSFASRMPFTNSTVGSIEGSSMEADEPAVAYSGGVGSVWWTWIAPSNGTYRFNLTALSNSYLPYGGITLFTGTSLATLQRVVTDPFYGISPVSASVVTGVTYVVRVTGLPSATTPFLLTAVHGSVPTPPTRFPPLPPTPLPPIPLPPTPESTNTISITNRILIANPVMVETSTNLIEWMRLTNAPATPGDFRFVPSTNEPMRFFRLR